MADALWYMGWVIGGLAVLVVVLELFTRWAVKKENKIKPFNPFNHE